MMEFPPLPAKFYSEIKDDIRSGDLLLCSGQSVFSTLIKSTTGSVWSHVAFLLRIEPIDRIIVLESVESIGVRAIPLTSYVQDYNGTKKGYPGRLMIARHEDVKAQNISRLSQFAVDLLGYPYRQEEIIHIAARLSMHALKLKNATPDVDHRRAFICSEYAQTCFQSIGVDFACNSLGFIAPVDFLCNPKVTPLYYLHTSQSEKERITPTLHTISDAMGLTI